MSRRDELINRIAPAATDFDAYEEIAVFFNSQDGDVGTWDWMYTIYRANGEYLDRRLGTTGLNNPRIKPNFLHRALIADRALGAFIPKCEDWSRPGGGPNAGWFIKQRQYLSRASSIADEAEAYLASVRG